MSKVQYLLVSLPTSISPSNDHDEAFTALRAAVSSDYGTTYPFAIPSSTFKIGTLDALVGQADDLAKLSTDCETVVGKISDSLSIILEGDQDKIAQQKNINDSPWAWFAWSMAHILTIYRAGRPVPTKLLVEQDKIPCGQANW